MKLLFDLNHPAHFHLFHYVINDLSETNEILITAKNKDVLLDLLKRNGFKSVVLQNEKRKSGLFHSALGVLVRDYKLFKIVKKEKPDILIGTSVSITHVGKLLKVPSLYFGEDGYKAVPISYRIGYPFATHIISPKCVDVGRYNSKKIEYDGYHELSYLAPDTFIPSESILRKYNLDPALNYFLLRFSSLEAHHDIGKKGINEKLAFKIIQKLTKHGQVLISSEKTLTKDFEDFRLKIDPVDIHHIMAFSKLIIGDSQTMTAEAAIIGIPSIRCSSFVGQLMILEELEKKYNLTFGFLPGQDEMLLKKIDELLSLNKEQFRENHKRMLKDRINVRNFFVWFIENYPGSVKTLKENPGYMEKFLSSVISDR